MKQLEERLKRDKEIAAKELFEAQQQHESKEAALKKLHQDKVFNFIDHDRIRLVK